MKSVTIQFSDRAFDVLSKQARRSFRTVEQQAISIVFDALSYDIPSKDFDEFLEDPPMEQVFSAADSFDEEEMVYLIPEDEEPTVEEKPKRSRKKKVEALNPPHMVRKGEPTLAGRIFTFLSENYPHYFERMEIGESLSLRPEQVQPAVKKMIRSGHLLEDKQGMVRLSDAAFQGYTK